MDSIFIKEIEDSVTIVYMDDILIYAMTPELLEKYMKWILQKHETMTCFWRRRNVNLEKPNWNI